MKLFTLFLLLFSFFSYGADPLYYSRETDYYPEEIESQTITKQELLSQLENQIEKYADSLLLALLNENTPRINKEEIVREIQSIVEVKGKITKALIQVSQKEIEQERVEEEKDEDLSLWVKAQAELIRKKQSEVDTLLQEMTIRTDDFYVDLAFNGALVIVGGALFFIPAGQGVSFALFAGRLTLTAQSLGVLLASMGILEGVIDASYFLNEQEQKVISFISNLVISNPFARELLTLLSSSDERDRYLAGSLFASPSEESLIIEIVNAFENEGYSAKTRESMIKTLRAFPDMDSSLKKEVISFLKEIINDTGSPLSLRETAVNVLGFLGKGMPEAAEYLRKIGNNENKEVSKNENLRLIALVHLGGNRADFEFSINTTAEWLKGRNYKDYPLNIQNLEIPKAFLDLLQELQVEKTDLTNYITVLEELISSGVLDVEIKLEVFKILINWSEKNPEIKESLKTIRTNPVEDIRVYLEELSQEILSEKNSDAFSFWDGKLKEAQAKLEETETKISENPIKILIDIDSTITKFPALYPNLPNKTRTEIVKRIEKVTNIYKTIWNP